MKKTWKLMVTLLSATLLINSVFAISTMSVHAEPSEETQSTTEGSEGTASGEGISSEGETATEELIIDEENTGDADEDEILVDEELMPLLGDESVGLFAARSTEPPMGKFTMTFAEGSLEHAVVKYATAFPAEGQEWNWIDYTVGAEVEAVRAVIFPKGNYPLAVVDGRVEAEQVTTGEEPEGNPPTNVIWDYSLCGDVNEGAGLWLIPGWTYTFTGLEIVEEKPATLTVASYNNTNGKILYLDMNDVEQEVPAEGISEANKVEAKQVWWTYNNESKYTLNVDTFNVTVDDEEARKEFNYYFPDGERTDLWPNMSYSLSGIEFVEGRATLLWSYLDADVNEDKYVGNGNIKITGATYNGVSVTNTENHDVVPYWINGIDGGEAAFLPGTVVTIELVPDRGYQLTEFTINEQPNSTTAQGEISTFIFTVPPRNFHLGAKFTKMDDEVDSKASGISGGTLDIADNEYEKGTAALTVNNTSVSDEEESAFVANAQQAGFEVAKYVDLKLENRFYKGNTTDFWTTAENKTDLTSPATISLSLSDITADDFEIVHQKHNGSYEVLDATYSNGSVTFMTKSFSKFAIVAKGMKTSSTPETGSTTPPSSSSSSDDGDDEDTAPTVSTENSTTLGTVVGGSVVKDWNGLEKILENKTSTGNKTTDGNTTAAPIVLNLNQRNSTVPVSTLRALEASDSVGLHLMMGNGVAITIANGAGLKNQPAINLSSKVETTRNSKTISFASNTKLNALVALHMSVPKNVKEVKLYYYIKGHAYFLGTLTTLNGQVLFPISQLGIYKLVY